MLRLLCTVQPAAWRAVSGSAELFPARENGNVPLPPDTKTTTKSAQDAGYGLDPAYRNFPPCKNSKNEQIMGFNARADAGQKVLVFRARWSWCSRGQCN
eukprot:2983373-Prymnesium_polylepis.1